MRKEINDFFFALNKKLIVKHWFIINHTVLKWDKIFIELTFHSQREERKADIFLLRISIRKNKILEISEGANQYLFVKDTSFSKIKNISLQKLIQFS